MSIRHINSCVLILSLFAAGCSVDATETEGDIGAESPTASGSDGSGSSDGETAGDTGTAGDDTASSGDDGESVGEAEQNIIVINGSDPVFFWKDTTQTALRSLGQNALTTDGHTLASTSLAQSASGRKLLGYIAGCALPTGISIADPVSGESFQGGVGLAPEWSVKPLASESSQRWVTACLVQVLNGLGTHVTVRLSGNAPALIVDAAVAAQDAVIFNVHDATMFGNLFLQEGASAYACTDASLINGCALTVSVSMLQRICGLSPTCGIKLLGPCTSSCSISADSLGKTCIDGSKKSYPESISSSVQGTLALSLYPLCSF